MSERPDRPAVPATARVRRILRTALVPRLRRVDLVVAGSVRSSAPSIA